MSKRTRSYLFYAFVLLFIVITAYTIIYASGYKLNFSNFKLQKTGMLNIDTKPDGAIVLLDGKPAESIFKKIFQDKQLYSKTPLKLKNLLPGEYEVAIKLDGYWDWQKKLSIKPGITTYIEDVILFKKDLPLLLHQDEIQIFPSSNKQKVLVSTRDGNFIYDLASNEGSAAGALTPENISSAYWSQDDKKILVNNKWLYEISDRLIPVSQILPADAMQIRWNQYDSTLLYYMLDGKIFRLNLANNKSEQIYMQEKAIDFLTAPADIYTLMTANGQTILARYSLPEKKMLRKIDLPASPDYAFPEQTGKFLSVADKRRDILYLLDPSAANPLYETVNNAKGWQWISDDNLLFYNDSEIWTFDLKNNKKRILIRISEKILDAIWHPAKNYIIYNTSKGIFVIELDDREKNNITELFRSSKIKDLLLNQAGDILYFYAEIGNQKGFYKLSI